VSDDAQKINAATETTALPKTRSILIVDDDSVFGQRLGKAFTERGFNVLVCGTVEEALANISSCQLDIIITDLRIGQQNGLTIVEAVKAISGDTKTLMLSGYGNVSTAVAAVKLGVTEFLSKPADADEILEVLGITDWAKSCAAYALKEPNMVRSEHILRVFTKTGNNVSESARLLNMHRRTLQRILARARASSDAQTYGGVTP
jgi:two-component system response regulator RegA